MSKDKKDYKDIPTFVLEDVPVLNNDHGDDEHQLHVSKARLGGDPYPRMAKPRRSFSGVSETEDYSQPIGSPSLYNSTPYRTTSQGFTPSPAASVESSTSFHTAFSSPGSDNIMSSPFVSGDGKSPRMNLNAPLYKPTQTPPKNVGPSSANTTPQHMKYPKHVQSYQELRSSNIDSQGLMRRPNVEHPRQVSSPSAIAGEMQHQQYQQDTQQYQEQQQAPLPLPKPTKVPSIAAITWKATDPNEWTLDRVLYWLEMNKFGPDWIETFRQRNICGESFLALSNYQNLKKLGHFYSKGDEYDTSPSRFIHLLRKLLNRSISSNSMEMALQAEEHRSSLEDKVDDKDAASPTNKYQDPNKVYTNSDENLLDAKMQVPQKRQVNSYYDSRPVSSVENSGKSLWHIPVSTFRSLLHYLWQARMFNKSVSGVSNPKNMGPQR
jgi:hypothetical protein